MHAIAGGSVWVQRPAAVQACSQMQPHPTSAALKRAMHVFSAPIGPQSLTLLIASHILSKSAAELSFS